MNPKDAAEARASVLVHVSAYLAAFAVIATANHQEIVGVALALLAISLAKEAHRLLELEP